MKQFLRQILTIARMEFRFSVRRSAPLVASVLTCLVVAFGSLIFPLEIFKDLTTRPLTYSPEQVDVLAAQGYTVEEFQDLIHQFIIDWSIVSGAMMASTTMFMAFLLLPVATASVIPADRTLNVFEFINSTPINGVIYLTGKILGVFSLVLLVASCVFLLYIFALEVLARYYLQTFLSVGAIIIFLKLSLLDGIPILAWNVFLGVFVGLFFRTRKAALFPAFIAGLLGLYGWVKVFGSPSPSFPMDVSAYSLFQNYRTTAIDTVFKVEELQGSSVLGMDVPLVGAGQVLLMFGILLACFLILALLARFWLLWKENF